MSLQAERPTVAMPEAPIMLRMDGVSKRFGTFYALDKISFEIRQGEILGFLGPNGAGKTTAMRILAGYFPPTTGKVYVSEKDMYRQPEKLKRQVGYLPETVHLYSDMTVNELLTFVHQIKGMPRKNRRKNLEDILYRVGLWEVRNRLTGHLSKGYKQRLGLAQALVGDPDVLILDEPTSGLDPEQIHNIRMLIRELGRDKTIILSTHILPEVSMICDRVMIINKGRRVASGTVDELEAGLSVPQEVYFTMGDRHRRDEVTRLLSAIPAIREVFIEEERGDHVCFLLKVSQGAEVRPEINRLFADRHIPLLELRANRMSLEDIFLKIVVTERH